MLAAVITAVGLVIATIGGSWIAAGTSAGTRVQVVEEREQNHYQELKEDMRMNTETLEKLGDAQQDILRSQDALLRAFNIENPNDR